MSTLESFIDYCDNYQIANEGFLTSVKNKIKQKKMQRFGSKDKTVNSIQEAIKFGSSCTISTDNIDIIFSRGVASDETSHDIIKLYNQIMKSKDTIIKMLKSKAISNKDIEKDENDQVLEIITFFKNDDGKVDADVYVTSTSQWYLKSIVKNGFSSKAIEWQD